MYMEIRHLHHTYACDEIFFAQMKKATNYLLIRRFCYQSETRYSSFFLNYNPQNEMFARFGTKCYPTQNETFFF